MKFIKVIVSIALILVASYFVLIGVNRLFPDVLPEALRFGSWMTPIARETEPPETEKVKETESVSEAERDTEINIEISTEINTEIESEAETKSVQESMLTYTGGSEEFVDRLYVFFLGRKPSAEEVKAVADNMRNGVTAAEAAANVVNSQEFIKSGASDSEYLELLFISILKRDIDAEAKEHFGEFLASGTTRNVPLKAVIESQEFVAIAGGYGITPGNVQLNENRDIYSSIAPYVNSAYETFLGRKADIEGLNTWAGELGSGIATAGKFARGIISSKEYNDRNRSDAQFITDMYCGFLHRNPADADVNNWQNNIGNGLTREKTAEAIVGSDESIEICAKLGIRANLRQGDTIDPNRPMIALTFDDGPMNSVTNQILDVMEKYNVRGTFFCVGSMAKANPDILRREAALGCEIANHSRSHASLSDLSAEGVAEQLAYVNGVVAEATGITPRIVRPPYGNHNERARNASGCAFILWNVDTRDWEHKDAQRTYDFIMNNVKDGDIILMHDIQPSTGQAIPNIIPALLEKGYQLVTVSEMADLRGYPLNSGCYYYSMPKQN